MPKEKKEKPFRDWLARRPTVILKEPLIVKLRKQRNKQGGRPFTTTPQPRDITDLVRSQFDFTCPICEEIAEKVSAEFPERVTRTRVYEAVYKLSSKDRKAQEEGMVTLQKLGVLDPVIREVEAGWEKIKKGETKD